MVRVRYSKSFFATLFFLGVIDCQPKLIFYIPNPKYRTLAIISHNLYIFNTIFDSGSYWKGKKPLTYAGKKCWLRWFFFHTLHPKSLLLEVRLKCFSFLFPNLRFFFLSASQCLYFKEDACLSWLGCSTTV